MKQWQADKWEGLAVVFKYTTHKVSHKEAKYEGAHSQ